MMRTTLALMHVWRACASGGARRLACAPFPRCGVRAHTHTHGTATSAASAASAAPEQPAPVPSAHAQAFLAAAVKHAAESHMRFLHTFGDAARAHAGAVEEWMQTFYRRPRADLLLGAFRHALVTPGAFVRADSLPAAVFFAQVLPHMLHTAGEAHVLMEHLRAATRLPGAPSTFGLEHLDTVLRGMYLADRPVLDDYLAEVSQQWAAALVSGSQHAAREQHADLMQLATSLSPPRTKRNRRPLLEWPIPTLSIARFEKHVREEEFPLYGATRHWLMYTRAAQQLARTDPASFAVMSPELACELTKAMVDAYWSYFAATGDAAAIGRVLDVGTPYADFLSEYGDAYVTRYQEYGRDVGAAVQDGGMARQPLPAEFDEDPFSYMRFESSRYALWTLLTHAGTHTRVSEAFFEQLSVLSNEFVVMDPLTREESVTAFARSRLELMQALEASIAQLGHTAAQHGIGSGHWPQRMLAHEPTRSGVALLSENPAMLSMAPALSSTTALAATLASVPADAVSAVGARRDRRRK